LTPICAKSFVGWGFAPDPTEGSYSSPPFRGPILLRGEERRNRVRLLPIGRKKEKLAPSVEVPANAD